MGSELEFDGTLANVCEYLELSGVFDKKVGALLNKIKVTGLECDSRRVTKGSIFYAKKGLHYDPFEHLEEIKAKGAVAILIDGPELPNMEISEGEFTLPSMNFSATLKPAADEPQEHQTEPQVDGGKFQDPVTLGGKLVSMMSPVATEGQNSQNADQATVSLQDDIKDKNDAGKAASAQSKKSHKSSHDAKDNSSLGEGPITQTQDLISALRSPMQKSSEDEEQLRRSGRKVILNEGSSVRYAEASYHATSDTPEARAIAKANMLRLVLPSNRSLSALAGFIYGHPSRKLKLIGVTGTNGKSTITNLVAQMLNLSGHRCAVFGTLGYGFLDDMQKSANTTLEPISLQRELAHYLALGADYAVLEVSSIGFCENRVSGLRFYAGAFSNLSQDHLDYHKTMEDYFHAKLSFLRMIPAERLVINRNRETGQRLAEMIANTFEVGVENSYFDKRTTHNFLNIKKVNYKHSSLELMLNNGEKGFTRTELNLMGYFNAENYAVAMGIMLALGFEYKHMASLAPKLRPITGRMECFAADFKPRMIVDYAHTPDGVEQALRAAQSHLQGRGRIFAIVGCGGDRDKRKRPIMAMKASIFSDYAIFTADNPRSENVLDIIDDMMLGIAPSPAETQLNHSLSLMANQEGMIINGDDHSSIYELDHKLQEGLNQGVELDSQPWRKDSLEDYLNQELPEVGSLYKNVIVIPDREQAITYAFKHASAQDCIVVAGKGHEDYQIFADRTIHFSDRELCCKLLGITLPEMQDKTAAVIKEVAPKVKAQSAAKSKGASKTAAKSPVKSSAKTAAKSASKSKSSAKTKSATSDKTKSVTSDNTKSAKKAKSVKMKDTTSKTTVKTKAKSDGVKSKAEKTKAVKHDSQGQSNSVS